MTWSTRYTFFVSVELTEKVLITRNQMGSIAQAPVILFPFGEEEGATKVSIALRTIITNVLLLFV